MPPKVLIVGSGGREHAITRQLAASPQVPRLYVAPGNPGTATDATNLDFGPDEPASIVAFCRAEAIDLVIIGPEDPLISGLADLIRNAGTPVFGPGSDGARLEGDKEFAKEIMSAAGVPTASYAAFSDWDEALTHLDTVSFPVVVKACGAAQGKGVAVCTDRAAAVDHLKVCLRQQKFGAAGARVLIEECLTGPELSILAVTDGATHALLAPSRDHKRIGEGDTGPNTGGMGAFAPVTVDSDLSRRIDQEIIVPILKELERRGISYRGVLYAGLMLTPSGPQVLEFNCRFGDPETQVVLPLLQDDFLALVEAAAKGELAEHLSRTAVEPSPMDPVWPGAHLTDWGRHCVVVVGAAQGYPGSYPKGMAMSLPAYTDDAWIIQAGTGQDERGLVTAGGRILGAVGEASSLGEARRRAYALLEQVDCDDFYYRRDIAVAAGSAEG